MNGDNKNPYQNSTNQESTYSIAHSSPIIINGQKTSLQIYKPKQIDENQEFANQFISFVNYAYKESSERLRLLNDHDRLIKGRSLEDQLGKNDPSTFCLILFIDDEDEKEEKNKKIIGTITAKLYSIENLPITRNSLLSRNDGKLTPDIVFSRINIPNQFTKQNSIFWVLNSLAVNPLMQGKKIGSNLMDFAENEIIKRSKGLKLSSSIKKVIIVLTACAEMAGNLYLNKGYKIDDQYSYPPKTVGSTLGFTIVQMYKEFDLES